nr:PREDICTED: uncharacterized protein LOC103281719 [Anolis carolinensis]|eukprot:XP_008122039.1 PREDICTED: uncharacterized protein LOC103281719 [Anolis carolinensis]
MESCAAGETSLKAVLEERFSASALRVLRAEAEGLRERLVSAAVRGRKRLRRRVTVGRTPLGECLRQLEQTRRQWEAKVRGEGTPPSEEAQVTLLNLLEKGLALVERVEALRERKSRRSPRRRKEKGGEGQEQDPGGGERSGDSAARDGAGTRHSQGEEGEEDPGEEEGHHGSHTHEGDGDSAGEPQDGDGDGEEDKGAARDGPGTKYRKEKEAEEDPGEEEGHHGSHTHEGDGDSAGEPQDGDGDGEEDKGAARDGPGTKYRKGKEAEEDPGEEEGHHGSHTHEGDGDSAGEPQDGDGDGEEDKGAARDGPGTKYRKEKEAEEDPGEEEGHHGSHTHEGDGDSAGEPQDGDGDGEEDKGAARDGPGTKYSKEKEAEEEPGEEEGHHGSHTHEGDGDSGGNNEGEHHDGDGDGEEDKGAARDGPGTKYRKEKEAEEKPGEEDGDHESHTHEGDGDSGGDSEHEPHDGDGDGEEDKGAASEGPGTQHSKGKDWQEGKASSVGLDALEVEEEEGPYQSPLQENKGKGDLEDNSDGDESDEDSSQETGDDDHHEVDGDGNSDEGKESRARHDAAREKGQHQGKNFAPEEICPKGGEGRALQPQRSQLEMGDPQPGGKGGNMDCGEGGQDHGKDGDGSKHSDGDHNVGKDDARWDALREEVNEATQHESDREGGGSHEGDGESGGSSGGEHHDGDEDQEGSFWEDSDEEEENGDRCDTLLKETNKLEREMEALQDPSQKTVDMWRKEAEDLRSEYHDICFDMATAVNKIVIELWSALWLNTLRAVTALRETLSQFSPVEAAALKVEFDSLKGFVDVAWSQDTLAKLSHLFTLVYALQGLPLPKKGLPHGDPLKEGGYIMLEIDAWRSVLLEQSWEKTDALQVKVDAVQGISPEQAGELKVKMGALQKHMDLLWKAPLKEMMALLSMTYEPYRIWSSRPTKKGNTIWKKACDLALPLKVHLKDVPREERHLLWGEATSLEAILHDIPVEKLVVLEEKVNACIRKVEDMLQNYLWKSSEVSSHRELDKVQEELDELQKDLDFMQRHPHLKYREIKMAALHRKMAALQKKMNALHKADASLEVDDGEISAGGCSGRAGNLNDSVPPFISYSCTGLRNTWHREVTPEERSLLVQNFAKTISPDNDSEAAKKILEAYARQIEEEVYNLADSKMEYHHLMAEKLNAMNRKLDDTLRSPSSNHGIRRNEQPPLQGPWIQLPGVTSVATTTGRVQPPELPSCVPSAAAQKRPPSELEAADYPSKALQIQEPTSLNRPQRQDCESALTEGEGSGPPHKKQKMNPARGIQESSLTQELFVVLQKHVALTINQNMEKVSDVVSRLHGTALKDTEEAKALMAALEKAQALSKSFFEDA